MKTFLATKYLKQINEKKQDILYKHSLTAFNKVLWQVLFL